MSPLFQGDLEMGDLKQFVINFGSLPNGEHEFNFEVDDTFFQHFENSLIQKGDVGVLVVMEKKENMLLLDFTMEGVVTVPCDRCLEDLDLEIEAYNELIVKFGAEEEEETEEVVVLSPKEYELNVAQYIYEFLTVLIPLRNVHDEEENGQGCDPEVLKEIEKHLAKEPSNEKEEDAPIDPRWEALKNINPN